MIQGVVLHVWYFSSPGVLETFQTLSSSWATRKIKIQYCKIRKKIGRRKKNKKDIIFHRKEQTIAKISCNELKLKEIAAMLNILRLNTHYHKIF